MRESPALQRAPRRTGKREGACGRWEGQRTRYASWLQGTRYRVAVLSFVDIAAQVRYVRRVIGTRVINKAVHNRKNGIQLFT